MVLMRLAVFGLLFSPTAFAAPPLSSNLAATFVALLLVIGIIFVLAWLLKRMKIPSLMGAKSGMKVLGQLQLGQKERVVILDVNGEKVLLGVTAQQITLLKNIDPALDTEEPSVNTAGSDVIFSSQLDEIFKQNDAS